MRDRGYFNRDSSMPSIKQFFYGSISNALTKVSSCKGTKRSAVVETNQICDCSEGRSILQSYKRPCTKSLAGTKDLYARLSYALV